MAKHSFISIGGPGDNADEQALIELSGVPAGSTDLGTFTGTIIADNSDIKEALQALETAEMGEALWDRSGVTLSPQNSGDGVHIAGIDIGTVIESSHSTGTATANLAIQEAGNNPYAYLLVRNAAGNYIEAGLNADQTFSIDDFMNPPALTFDVTTGNLVVTGTVSGTNISATATNVSNLVTLSGVAANEPDLGTFTGSIIPDDSDIKEALQSLETAIGSVSSSSLTSLTSITALIDSNADSSVETFTVYNDSITGANSLLQLSESRQHSIGTDSPFLNFGNASGDFASTDKGLHIKTPTSGNCYLLLEASTSGAQTGIWFAGDSGAGASRLKIYTSSTLDNGWGVRGFGTNLADGVLLFWQDSGGNTNIPAASTFNGVIIGTHDHGGTGGAARLAAKDRRRLAPSNKSAADTLATDATAEHMVFQAVEAVTITGAFFLPDAALTGDGTNNATLKVWRRNNAGAAQSAVASLTTTASWTAFDGVSLGALTNTAVTAGQVITIEITKANAGVAVPSGTWQIEYTVD